MGQKRNNDFNEYYQEYLNGLSLQQIAVKYGKTRQGVFKAFKLRGFKLRETFISVAQYEQMKRESDNPILEKVYRKLQMYDGKKFTLRNSGYYSLTTNDRKLMHRYVWEKEVGPIPDGYDIHHLDEDKENNKLSNLECLPKPEHTRKYSPHNNQYTKGRKRASN